MQWLVEKFHLHFSNLCVLNLLSQYMFANNYNSQYTKTGKASLKFQLINQRADFSFALFSGGLSNVCPRSTNIPLFFFSFSNHNCNIDLSEVVSRWFCNLDLLIITWLLLQPKLVAVSNSISFVNPKAPLYPRLAQGKSWNEVSLSN